ncbi:hypothetical protein SAMN04488693_105129 [Arthrobacter subterraneus]|uniref:Uncharacterized protein n=1 Tax=Arthrobacter subterraneus TaxID=335973 RepID=A0A1G8HAE2_9MICC|nr:hypothetical protein [Arthrobacter subterraneus]SDI03549.1 hypothetical protein SAMN04488693_105129 [Arthrobacter subterraneus]
MAQESEEGADVSREPLGIDPPERQEQTVEHVAEDVRSEIRLGHVEDDVTHVLEERLDEAGVHLRPEKVDDLAEDIENDVST